jgi:hypothetical protein
MDVVREILEIAGYDSAEDMDVGDPITLSAPGVMDLTIEKVATSQISASHYWKQNGDLMRDPEIVFDTDSGWMPVRYRQDPSLLQVDEDGLDIQDFVGTWEKNLRSQGFIDAAETEFSSDN